MSCDKTPFQLLEPKKQLTLKIENLVAFNWRQNKGKKFSPIQYKVNLNYENTINTRRIMSLASSEGIVLLI